MAPSIIAITESPGMPSVRVGIKAVIAAELLAASGPETPSIAPLPNRSGRLDTRSSVAYDMNEDMVPPAPGKIPKKEPMIDPRAIGPIERFTSSLLGRTLRRLI